jgi:type II secretion system protein G
MARRTQQTIASLHSINVNRLLNMGFTLAEVLAVIVIIGILSSIALPNYLNQLSRTRQSEAASSITQLQNAIVAFADENGIYPTSWKELNEVAAIMTPSGATTQNDFKKMTLASVGCKKEGENNCYTVEATYEKEDALYTLTAMPVDSRLQKYNIIACLDLRLGTSDFKKGKQSGAAKVSSLVCGDPDD